MSRLRQEGAFTLAEMVTVMAILTIVLGGLAVLLEQGASAELDMNNRFQAQEDARQALDRMRRDLHCATQATSSSSTSVTFSSKCADPTVTNDAAHPFPQATQYVTWCVATLNGRQGLFRRAKAQTCGTGDQRFADYVSSGSTYFAYQAQNTNTLATLYVCVPINVKVKRTVDKYALTDAIVLRNSTRTGASATVAQPACP